MFVQPYLFFDGRREEAVGFYRAAVGAEVGKLMRYGDSPEGAAECPDGSPPPAGKVMHGSLGIGASMVLVSDGFSAGQPKFEGFALSLSVADAAEAKRAFDALADGGRVDMPLGPTFFSPGFGMLVDRFGVHWMVMATQPMQAG